MLLHYLVKRRSTKIASFYLNAVLLHSQTSTSRCFNLFSLVTCNWRLYDSPNLVLSELNSGLLWGHSSGERKLMFCTATVEPRWTHWCTVFKCLDQKMVVNDIFNGIYLFSIVGLLVCMLSEIDHFLSTGKEAGSTLCSSSRPTV